MWMPVREIESKRPRTQLTNSSQAFVKDVPSGDLTTSLLPRLSPAERNISLTSPEPERTEKKDNPPTSPTYGSSHVEEPQSPQPA